MKHSDSILSPFQHGFRRNRSCDTQLLQFTADIANILALDKQTDVLVMDFSKAFDKVGHGRLLHKLGHYGVRGKTQRWIQGFLSGRTELGGCGGGTALGQGACDIRGAPRLSPWSAYVPPLH